MGRRDDAYDNALAESFWSTHRSRATRRLCLHRPGFRADGHFECWFVPWRRHSWLGMLSPAEFERQWRANRSAEEVMA